MKKKFLKIGVILVVLVTIIVINTNAFGAINEKYYTDILESTTVDNENTDTATESSPLLEAIAFMIYAVGALLEKILGSIFEMISGDNIFPWADAIVFNAIPILDINVFNPSGASLITSIQGVIQDTYWTVFTLALVFFGIAVMVTAIKLAISTIASDKALYKQAIVKWLVGFAMLWGIHLFMSFAIYLNENLVIEAQKIASESIGDTVINIDKLYNSDDIDKNIVESFVKAMSDAGINWTAAGIVALVVGAACFIFIPKVGLAAAAIIGIITGIAYGDTIGAQVTVALTQVVNEIDRNIVRNVDIEDAKKTLAEDYKVAASLLRDKNYRDRLEYRVNLSLQADDKSAFKEMVSSFGGLLKIATSTDENGNIEFLKSEYGTENAIKLVAVDARTIASKGTDTFTLELTSEENGGESTAGQDIVSYYELCKAYVKTVEILIKKYPLTVVRKEYNADTQKILNSYYVDDKDGGYKQDECYEDPKNPLDMTCPSKTVTIIKVNEEGEFYTEQSKIKDAVNYDVSYYNHAKDIIRMVESHSTYTESKNTNVISALGKAFKKMAWQFEEGSWIATRVSISGALLYALLVAQSLIFFISYAKRLFYIIILILMAPIVVVYDFFTKFSS